MENSLTKLEIDAVFQLIQLSATSSLDAGVFCRDFPAERREENSNKEEEGSAGAASSSFAINNPEECDEEPLPRRKDRFGSLIGIYGKTRPLIKINRPGKRARF